MIHDANWKQSHGTGRVARPRPLLMAVGLAVLLGVAGGADGALGSVLDMLGRQSRQLGLQAAREAKAWYVKTPPMERVTWGGLVACGFLGALTALERSWSVRRSRIVPSAFASRFQKRLNDGQLDRGKSLDYCELNPSPAACVALAAVQRWGRPAADMERGTALASQRETARMRRHIGTLRRVAGMAPLIGLLGTLTAASRILAALGPGMVWGPAIASALGPLTIGVGIAILALVFFDGLTSRVETLASELDRIGAETVDAIVSQVPVVRDARSTRPDPASGSYSPPPPHSTSPPYRAPVPVRPTRTHAHDQERES